jgi:hypothetical protein
MMKQYRRLTGFLAACAVSYALSACAGAEQIPLRPEAARIEIVKGEPDRKAFQYLGEVQGEAKASDVGEANTNARNDIRNKAAALGATVVVLDTNTAANAMDWSGRNKVVLTGRAFRPVAH